MKTEPRRHSDFFLLATTMSGDAASLRQRLRLILRQPKMLGVTLIAVLLVVAAAALLAFGGAQRETTWGELAREESGNWPILGLNITASQVSPASTVSTSFSLSQTAEIDAVLAYLDGVRLRSAPLAERIEYQRPTTATGFRFGENYKLVIRNEENELKLASFLSTDLSQRYLRGGNRVWQIVEPDSLFGLFELCSRLQVERLEQELRESGARSVGRGSEPPPTPELSRQRQQALDALLNEFSAATAQAWLESMLDYFRFGLDNNYVLQLDWRSDSGDQGWVLAKLHWGYFDNYFYILDNGELRHMDMVREALSIDTSGAPQQLVIVDSGNMDYIDLSHLFPHLITSVWDGPLTGEDSWPGISDPLTGRCAAISHSEYWLPLIQGQLYGANKSATLIGVETSPMGLTLIYAEREGDMIFVGGDGAPNMELTRGEAWGQWQLEIPEARLAADLVLDTSVDGPAQASVLTQVSFR